MSRRYATPEEAFIARAEWRGDCLIWTGSTSAGYGQISVGGKRIGAHRYAWEQTFGPIPPGRQVDHTCFVRACVRAEHLRLATPAENQRNKSGQNANNLSSGFRNVYRQGSRFRVRIEKEGVVHNFGQYATAQEAADVAEIKRMELFGSFRGRGVNL